MKYLTLTALLVASAWSYTSTASELDKDRSDMFANSCRKALDVDGGKSSPTFDDAISIAGCYGYIEGFINGHNMTADHVGNAKQFCIPDGVALIQLARLVVKSSDDRPDIGHHPRETLVEYALKSTWPCDEGGT